MWTPDPPTHATPPSALRQFSIAVVGFLAFGVFTQMTTPAPVATPRDYPYEGLVVELGGIEQNKVRRHHLLTDNKLSLTFSNH